ncbi:hypothetical protein C2845_PM11G19180 [Panicum miliaceum]|uniref:Uncharacterized protein n=1 Tax=Panicum miliaceum TaxID=4540 RepID=A0A3L6RN46_PANMI|nr:hypothetical protein C2845_PM11G19180 [Panicum miliaceum]
MAGEPDADDGTSCSRWSCDFAVAHAIFATGFITAPVAVLHLLRRPHWAPPPSSLAISFATVSLVLCCRFYAELKRPPWPRWRLSAAPVSSSRGGHEAAAGAELSHDLRHPEQPVTARVEIQAN